MTAAVVENPTRASLAADESDRTVPSVTKALQLLDAFRDARGALGVSEIARLAGVPKSTAFRLLSYLEKAGFVERAGKEYLLGGRLFELGNSVPMCRRGGLREVAMPHLSELFVATGKVVQLGILEGTDVVYLEKIIARDTVDVPTAVGQRMPSACTALGKAMLAFSDRDTIGAVLDNGLVRRTRYSHVDPARFLNELRRVHQERIAFDREEVSIGLVCVAAPVLRAGRAVGAVSVSGRATQFNPAVAVTHVRRTAEAISRQLG
ncbi:IclR family transcriptional regulator [Nocardioides sp. CER19]|uniref:IclR family transcriptional regulator n=1 Tax=Nocardioides sp. CER19 TaxID=3038538 RepID=UPI00244B91D1|nr:IclR family transcriptional regulator [Nocardioides sp. CER19]MDH2412998.1 IclR family transcriptional regulator [Nocardioides sp. CER19]